MINLIIKKNTKNLKVHHQILKTKLSNPKIFMSTLLKINKKFENHSKIKALWTIKVQICNFLIVLTTSHLKQIDFYVMVHWGEHH